MRHQKFDFFQNAVKLRGNAGGSIHTIMVAVRARKSKKILKSSALGGYDYVYVFSYW